MSDNIVSFSYHTILLSEEIVLEVLLRVSPKSLIRFKSVSKQWCDIISNPQFLAKNLIPARDDDTLLLVKRWDMNKVCVFSLLSYHNLAHWSQTRPLPYPDHPRKGKAGIKILGPCNGLVCAFDEFLGRGHHIALWRPVDGEMKILPPSDVPNPAGAPPGAYCLRPRIGFGYDSTTDDYKVIRISVVVADGYECNFGCKVEIYSFKTDSWKGIIIGEADLCLSAIADEPGAYANGVFSWWSKNFDRIVWFRMSDETFGTIRAPTNMTSIALRFDHLGEPIYPRNYFPYRPNWHKNLCALSDRNLALVMYDWTPRVEKRFHIWVLLEFGVEESWTRLFTVGPWERICHPIWFWRYDKMIMENIDNELVLCDVVTNELKSLNIRGASWPLKSQIIPIEHKYVGKIKWFEG